ncbi:MAG: T9SS type A sorting domain-containing protein [bacterium]|nr:T9SS type A sorting domain-containing protein [bacterium]
MRFVGALLTFLTTLSMALAYSSGPPDNMVGNPSSCTQCHNSFTVNSGNGSLSLLGTPPTGYVPGQVYPLQVELQDPGQARWGFELTAALQSNSSQQGGTLATANGNTQVSNQTGNARDYIKHTSSGTSAGTQNGPVTWTFNWTAPSAGAGNVVFYFAGNAANNNGSTSGDYIYTSSVTLVEATPPNQPPNAFSLLTPANGAVIRGMMVNVGWEENGDPNQGDVVRYKFIYSTDSTMAQSDTIDTDMSSSTTISALVPGTTYYWKVQARDQLGATRLSNQMFHFSTEQLPPVDPPQCSMPTNGASVSLSANTTFTWEPATGGAPGNTFDYVIWFFTPTDSIAYPTDSDTSVTVRLDTVALNLSSFPSFMWTVQANSMSPAVSIRASDMFVANIASAASDPVLPNGFTLSEAYPNPFNSTTKVNMSLPNSASVRGELFNMNGQLVASYDWGMLSGGQHVLSIEQSQISAGTYIFRVYAGNVALQRRIVYLR